jgi:site-specific recombinase XerD
MATRRSSTTVQRMKATLALGRVGLTLDSDDPPVPVRAQPTTEGARRRGTGDVPRRAHTPTAAEAIAAFLLAVRSRNKSPETVRSYRGALAHFARWIEARRPEATCAELTHELADAYVHYLRHEYLTSLGTRLSDCSVHQYVAVLKIFARWGARAKRYWPANPLAEYETPAFTASEIVPYSHEELRALLAACGSNCTFKGRRLRAMFLLALDTGLRRAEIRRLAVPMVDDRTGRVHLPSSITKTRRSRTVHLQEAALAALKSWLVARNALPDVTPASGPLFCQLSGAPLTDGAMQQLAVRLRERSGVARFRWHLMRHTAGTESLRHGADSVDVQETLGHATGEMVRRYLHLTDDDRRERYARYSPVQALLQGTDQRASRFRRKQTG